MLLAISVLRTEICLSSCDPQSDHIPIKIINTSEPLSIFKKTMEFEGGLTMIVSCSGQIDNLTCQSFCHLNPSQCAGDSDYCSLYSCLLFSSCWCSITNLTRTFKTYDKLNQEGLVIDSIASYKVKPFIYSNKKSAFGFKTHSFKRYFVGNCPVDFNVKLNAVTLNTQSSGLTVLLSHLDFSVVQVLKQGKNVILLPIASLFTMDRIKIRVFDSSETICDLSLNPDYFSLCFKPQCVVCTEFFSSPCIPQLSKDIVIALIVIVILISLALLISLYFLFKQRQKVFSLLFTIRKFILTKLNKKEIDHIDLEEFDFSSDSDKKIVIKGSIPLNTMLLLILISFNTTSSLTCSDEFFLSSGETVTCTHQNQLVTCNAQIASLITLSHLGSTSCLTLKDPTSGLAIATLSLEYKSGYWVCPTTTKYYTSDWITILASSKQCPLDPRCISSSNCDNFDQGNYNAYGLLQGLATTLPGVTNCLNTCGGWGCSCALFDNSCTYTRWALSPTGSVYSNNQINECIFNAELKFSITDADNETTTLFVPSSGSITWGSLSLTFSGSLPVSSPNIMNYDILTDGVSSYKVSTTSLGQFVTGQVGDIQGASSTSIQRPTRTSFDFSHSICTQTTTNTAFKVDCSKPGVKVALQSAPKFPLFNTYGVSSMNGQDQVVLLSNPPSVVIQMQSDSFIFQRIVSIVCPAGGLLSEVTGNPLLVTATPDNDHYVVTGCYNCPQGFSLGLVLSSTCAEGLVDLEFINNLETIVHLNIKTLSLRNEWDIFIVSLSSNSKLVNGILKVKGKTLTEEIAFSATLMDPEILLITNSSNTNSVTSVVNQTLSALQDPFAKWWDSIFPDLPFLKYIIIGGISLISIIVIFVVIKLSCF